MNVWGLDRVAKTKGIEKGVDQGEDWEEEGRDLRGNGKSRRQQTKPVILRVSHAPTALRGILWLFKREWYGMENVLAVVDVSSVVRIGRKLEAWRHNSRDVGDVADRALWVARSVKHLLRLTPVCWLLPHCSGCTRRGSTADESPTLRVSRQRRRYAVFLGQWDRGRFIPGEGREMKSMGLWQKNQSICGEDDASWFYDECPHLPHPRIAFLCELDYMTFNCIIALIIF